MKLKNLLLTFIALAFSTLAMAQTFPANPGTLKAPAADGYTYDTIVISKLFATTPATTGTAFSNKTITPSGTTYAGNIAVNSKFANSMYFRPSQSYIANSTTVGRIHSVEIKWAVNSPSNSLMRFYVKNSKYTAASVETSDYTINRSQSKVEFPDSYTHFLMCGTTNMLVDTIIVGWNILTPHNISVTPNANGNISLSPNVSQAKENDKITVTFTPNAGYEFVGYIINGKTTNVTATTSAYAYNLTMPNKDVTIEGIFNEAVQRSQLEVTGIETLAYEMISGEELEFSWDLSVFDEEEFEYTIVNNFSASNVTITSSNTSVVTLGTKTANSVHLTAKSCGTTKLTISTKQTNLYLPAIPMEVTITVRPKPISMIAQDAEGNYYAVTTNYSNGMLAAKLVSVFDNKIINDNSSEVKWYLSLSGNGYVIQNSRNQYLAQENYVLVLSSNPYIWIRSNSNAPFAAERGNISYHPEDGGFRANNEVYSGTPGYTTGAIEGGFISFETTTLPRNLVKDQFNTVCLPYAFTCSNTDVHFYSVACMEEINGKYNFNFDEEDFTVTPSQAGIPYIVRAEDGNHNKDLAITKIGEEVALSKKNGLIGVDVATSVSELPNYSNNGLLNIMVFYQGVLNFAKSGKVGANSAYIQFEELPTCDHQPASSARRVVLEVEMQEAPEIATSVENTLNATNINWNEPVYNLMGQRVARGTTGVLIQNGKKFIAE